MESERPSASLHCGHHVAGPALEAVLPAVHPSLLLRRRVGSCLRGTPRPQAATSEKPPQSTAMAMASALSPVHGECFLALISLLRSSFNTGYSVALVSSPSHARGSQWDAHSSSWPCCGQGEVFKGGRVIGKQIPVS